jgi:hypothetical protein
VWLVAAHSVAVGLALLVAPDFTARFAGFGPVTPIFFARQAGVFHLVMAVGYLVELRRGGVTLLVFAKTTAFVFLTASWLAGAEAWSVPFSGLSDGAMALVAWWLWRRASPPLGRGPPPARQETRSGGTPMPSSSS